MSKRIISKAFIIFTFHFTEIIGYDATHGRPKIISWLKRVKSQANPFFDEGHEFIYKYAEKYKGVPPIDAS